MSTEGAATNSVSMYDVEAHVAELYDRQESYTDDVELIRTLIAGRGPLRILEPFCGTGRILVPLALDGHTLVGIDRAGVMLARAQAKLKQALRDDQDKVTLVKADVLAVDWPRGFDLVILGGNCLYELATAGEQERCIAEAALSLHPGGCLYLDNDHMEGELAESWRRLDVDEAAFPTGRCDDGTDFRSHRRVVWFDAANRLARYWRQTIVTFADGRVETHEYLMQKHPPSTVEMQAWIEAAGLTVSKMYGDRAGGPYHDASNRAIFWASREQR